MVKGDSRPDSFEGATRVEQCIDVWLSCVEFTILNTPLCLLIFVLQYCYSTFTFFMLLCEILVKISKVSKFYPIRAIFEHFVFATWVSVFTDHVPLPNMPPF